MIIRNFLFHRVTDEKDQLWPPMTPRLFEKIIKTLSNNYHIVNLESFVAQPQQHKKRLASVMFDDGYKDNIDFAAPILKKYACPASFYIATDCIDRNLPTWTYLMDFTLQHTQKPAVELPYDYVPVHFKKLPLASVLTAHVKKLKPWMKSLPNYQRLQIMELILEQCNDVQIPSNQMLSWDEVRQLHTEGFNIGSHTHTHPMLARLHDEQEIKAELHLSFEKITQHLGTPPVTISYPIGSYDARVMALSKQAGYNLGLAVEQRFYQTGKDPLFAIPRVELYDEPWYKVSGRINGIYNYIKRLWK
jgi:peptidoglycan/xylan/chitin deacetylase (PgdA/CDA1 family)